MPTDSVALYLIGVAAVLHFACVGYSIYQREQIRKALRFLASDIQARPKYREVEHIPLARHCGPEHI
jgi:hypothetical protein